MDATQQRAINNLKRHDHALETPTPNNPTNPHPQGTRIDTQGKSLFPITNKTTNTTHKEKPKNTQHHKTMPR
jgi:hypothetical protein